MSAGGFINSRYELSAGDEIRVRIRVQPETLSLTVGTIANAAPAGALTPNYPSARVSGSRRSIGINPRMVRFKFTGEAPVTYKGGESTLSVPVLTPEFYELCVPGATGTYSVAGSTAAIEIVGTTPEFIK